MERIQLKRIEFCSRLLWTRQDQITAYGSSISSILERVPYRILTRLIIMLGLVKGSRATVFSDWYNRRSVASRLQFL